MSLQKLWTPSLRIFRLAGVRGRGVLKCTTEPNYPGKNAAVYLTTISSQTFEHFLSELKNLAFCMEMVKKCKNIRSAFFDQDMTYFISMIS
jgi:hypothetical protein